MQSSQTERVGSSW